MPAAVLSLNTDDQLAHSCSASCWPPWEKGVRFKQPVGAWERASEVIRSKLEADPPRNPIEDVTVTLSGFTRESGTQMGFSNPSTTSDCSRASNGGHCLGPPRADAGGDQAVDEGAGHGAASVRHQVDLEIARS